MTAIRHILLALCLAWPAGAAADSLFDRGGPDFLPVDEAFRPALERTGEDELAVVWAIASGYYLYRHAFDFALVDAGGAGLGTPAIPDGERHEDEFFGEVETYRDRVSVTLPLTGEPAADARLRVHYQGCADAGLCYPPQTRLLALGGAGDPVTGGGTTGAADGATDDDFVATQDRLAARLAGGGLAWIAVSFLGLGVLLAFTPCVLPMLPILSGLIVGTHAGLGGHRGGALRGLSLSVVYVLAMAAAYTVFGVLAGLLGANLQASLQSPWVLVPFALVFVVLALAMFGVYQLQLPAAWQSRLNAFGQGGGRPRLWGAAVLGFFSALIVGPCLAPPLAGALLYIGGSGDPLLGGLALFALGLGMGLPLIVLGTVGGGVLPRPGPWMDEVRVFFGVVLVGVALWLLARVLPGPAMLALWAVLLAGYGVHLGALEWRTRPSAGRPLQAAGVLALIYAGILLVGAASGAHDPLRPLQPLAAGTATDAAGERSALRRVGDVDALRAALAAAERAGRPALVDFYADWCVECVRMERTVFSRPEVHRALAGVAALQVDVTDYDAADRALLREFDVLGPPTILFFGADGRERRRYRLIGETDVDGFLTRLDQALNP